ncbi:MAG: hypothetical protein HY319_02535 [Armatimonadetes bacterium]|nr:hypothetical protein [Armatimonadota bacterium]
MLLLLALLTGAAWGESADFPADPADATVVDRVSLEVSAGDQSISFYALLYSRGEQSFLEIYKQATPWQKLHTWKIEFQGEPVNVPPRSVLHILEDDAQLVFFWRSFVGYQEGAVSLALTYDRATGKFSTSWSD